MCYDGDNPCDCALTWHSNGVLSEKITYYDTPSRQDIKSWDRKGVLRRKGEYLEDGTYLYFEYNEDGEVIKEKKDIGKEA